MKQKNARLNRISILLLLITCHIFPALAQRDYNLTENRNVWLTSNNVAALTTFADSSISKGSLSYGYEGGRYRGLSDGSNEMTLKADARSYYRLSNRIMGYGSVTYTNFSGTDMTGSMIASGFRGLQRVSEGIRFQPFDIIQPEEDAGRKHEELFNVAGGIGWNVWNGLSIGAKADFSAGSYAKYKDLRHSNTLMNLDAMASLIWNFGSKDSRNSSVGASLLYNRSTETIKYKTYGTTDHVYQVLLDYANHYGEILTYGGDGFIDDNTELPLFDERCGFSVQGSIIHKQSTINLMAEFTYLHRHGYYGKQSQYTASYEQHSGNSYGWKVRLNLPKTKNTISWLDVNFNSEGLTTYKKNYRQVKSQDNTSVTYYEYYAPTKMSDKVCNSGSLAYTLYLKPLGAIFLWQMNVGTHYLCSKQTAYLYPETITRKATLWTPFVYGKRNILLSGRKLLGIEIGLSAQCGNMDILMDGIGRQMKESVGISYEFPMFKVRPSVSLHYSCAEANDICYSKTYRHNIVLSLGVIF